MIRRIREAILRHELWVLRTSRETPFLAVPLASTLWLWCVPAIPLYAQMLLWIPYIETGPGWLIAFDALLVLVVGGPALLIALRWHTGWHFIALGLMRGRETLAMSKEAEIHRKLEALSQ